MNIKIFVFLLVALMSMLCSVSAQYRWGELLFVDLVGHEDSWPVNENLICSSISQI